jgi:hypothetical protein
MKFDRCAGSRLRMQFSILLIDVADMRHFVMMCTHVSVLNRDSSVSSLSASSLLKDKYTANV